MEHANCTVDVFSEFILTFQVHGLACPPQSHIFHHHIYNALSVTSFAFDPALQTLFTASVKPTSFVSNS